MTSKKMGQSPLFNLIRDTEKDKKNEESKKHENLQKKENIFTTKSHASGTVKANQSEKVSAHTVEHTVITSYQQDRKKATYYIRKDLLKKFKMYSAEVERDMSDLVSEAIEGMISKK